MHRISLTNEFLEGSNNAYLIAGDETVLVDTGSDTQRIRGQLTDGFAAADRSVTDLNRVYLTHYHIDHCGLVAWLVAKSGASVHAHPADAPLIEGRDAAWQRVAELRTERLDSWGVPADAVGRLDEAFVESADRYGTVTVEPVADDTPIDAGGTELRALHTPGHSLGHLSFTLTERNEILTGDALLPEYTPNVGGADVRVENPLTTYIGSLRRLADGGFDRAWPGHRKPITEPTARARETIAHHEHRAMRVLDILREHGGMTVWEVSRELFGSLDGVHILHGPGEAYAHLDHLVRTGALVHDGREYRLTATTTDDLREPGDRWSLP